MDFSRIKKIRTNSKYIVLKEGNNIPLMVGFVVILLIVILVCTSKYFLPDSRTKMSFVADSKLNFNMVEITLPTDVLYDTDKNILEFKLTERYLSTKEEYIIDYDCIETDYGSLPLEVIKSDYYTKNESDVIKYRDLILQVRVPQNFYYISVNIKQDGNSSNSFTIDYRDTNTSGVTEKASDYLINLNASKAVLAEKENRQNVLKEEITSLTEKKEKTTDGKALQDYEKQISDDTAELNNLVKEISDLQSSLQAYEEE